MWNPFRRPAPPTPPAAEARPHFLQDVPYSTHTRADAGAMEASAKAIVAALPRMAATTAMDDSSTGMPEFKARIIGSPLPDELVGWFMGQSFIGYQTCALIAQNWLVDKAISMPARDAVRHGWAIHVEGAPDEDTASGIITDIQKLDKALHVRKNLEQFIKMGRLFGVRVLIFQVDGIDYEAPFNPDGVKPGSYKGMAQVDPYWCIPELDAEAVQDPSSPNFYEPTWWQVNGQRYHRSHLCIFRANEVPDLLKPVYRYGGISVPQRIVERVYAAERTANEGPQLAMTKRLTVWKTDMAALYANQTQAAEHMAVFAQYRDNHGVKLVDIDDTLEQHDTGLADLDVTIMTQYQLVAAAAGVPATKLLGTTPKGFNATGEYDEASYHEELETVQSNDLTPLLDRHYMLLMRSQGLDVSVTIDWAPVDSPTALEWAMINKTKAETDNALVQAGAVDGLDVRNRIKKDPNSEYTGIADVADEVFDPLDPGAAGGTELEGDPEVAAVASTLNGAQVASMLAIVSQVSAGEIPYSTGVQLISNAFGMSEEKAKAILGEAVVPQTPAIEA